jgi:hypothetical protein
MSDKKDVAVRVRTAVLHWFHGVAPANMTLAEFRDLSARLDVALAEPDTTQDDAPDAKPAKLPKSKVAAE